MIQGMLRVLYTRVLQYPSRFFFAAVLSAVGFDIALNDLSDRLFLSVNKGKLWRDVKPIEEEEEKEES